MLHFQTIKGKLLKKKGMSERGVGGNFRNSKCYKATHVTRKLT